MHRQGHEFYLPQFLARQGSETTVKPLFRPYLFVKIDGTWAWLTGTFGINRVLIGDDGGPAHLADEVIADWKAREGSDGLVRLASEPVPEEFMLGEQLRVTSGPFWGYKGIHSGSSDRERETILLGSLGRVRIPRKDLERL